MFWNCAHPLHGNGFLVHHIKCPAGLKFNPISNECDAYRPIIKTMRQFSKSSEDVSEIFHCEKYGFFPGMQ